MRVACLISSTLIVLSAVFRNIACSPSLVIISNEIIVTTRRPAFYHFSSAHPYTTKAPPKNQFNTIPGRNVDNWPRTVTFAQPTQASSKQSSGRSTNEVKNSKLPDLHVTPGTPRGITVSQGDGVTREKRFARGGAFGNTGRGGPRERLDYNSSAIPSLSAILFFMSLLTCLHNYN